MLIKAVQYAANFMVYITVTAGCLIALGAMGVFVNNHVTCVDIFTKYCVIH